MTLQRGHERARYSIRLTAGRGKKTGPSRRLAVRVQRCIHLRYFAQSVIKMYDTRGLSQRNGVANSCSDGLGNLAARPGTEWRRRGGSDANAVQDRYVAEPISLREDGRRRRRRRRVVDVVRLRSIRDRRSPTLPRSFIYAAAPVRTAPGLPNAGQVSPCSRAAGTA